MISGRAPDAATAESRRWNPYRPVYQSRPRVDSAFAGAAPGLMTGLAGVGYGLIALAHPTGLPLVLALEPASP